VDVDFITPTWPAPLRVNAWVTLRNFGDMARDGRRLAHGLLQKEPVWMRQVHGTSVIDADDHRELPRGNELPPEADAAIARTPGTVCAVMIADCMPVFLTDEAGSAVAVAHAGWRGLCAGVIEQTIAKLSLPEASLLAWLGPAIGSKVYEVGDEVRAAFLARDSASHIAFAPTRPGHWLLDLYAVARQRLNNAGVDRIYGGGFCTYTDASRFFSFRRDRAKQRMAALIWLA